MKFDIACRIAAPLPQVWALITDVPQVSAAIPGLSDVVPLGDDRFQGTLSIRVGPVQLHLDGTVTWEERDEGARVARFRADARDRKVAGGLQAAVTLSLQEQPDGMTELRVLTEATFLGKLGEFGYALVARKAQGVLEEFAANLQGRLAGGGGSTGA
jgi:carbon monoxide dehydrogenase subunit G